MTGQRFQAIETLRELIETELGWTPEEAKVDLAALDALQALAEAAKHYLNGTDPDGWINLAAALARVEGEQA